MSLARWLVVALACLGASTGRAAPLEPDASRTIAPIDATQQNLLPR